jgi:hypothetical protein
VLKCDKEPYHGMEYSVEVKVPSIGGLILKGSR